MTIAEGVQLITVIILAALVLTGALGVVLFENIVYSAFTLGAVFVGIAGIYLLQNADFVSAAQVLIYVGAINVLILFAIMLVNKREDFQPLPRRWIRKGGTALVCVGLFVLLSVMLVRTDWNVNPTVAPPESTLEALGLHFFSDYLLPFELASILLLMALIGAVVLARREYVVGVEDVVVGEQNAPILELPERPKEPVS
ncbi:NADH-quinone oxidoreductase subunit J [Lyngbya confervoides]|uniref:NADH-quinone oxidoreductase subunit J n=1 Tax=Lyngbya confervoides BDU141951 TaxID=1574623 RepID=A0ABD4T4L0_9CYAN|nr:NADH-quinone oxidoreductase subunit J [Lyngbya confervoides]MCM1983385.1 NADH-quinone oxidoreductase subunit J [Lyngbya confervoides BDU141951]